MAQFYELTVMVRADEPVSEDAFNDGVDLLANRVGGHAMHRVSQVRERDVPVALRDSEEAPDGG